eukprot:CAMPEP_0113265588 /NCGR_PEP_ID=MMETSP0008_2-20120614/19588_1 /TAXON_ID=97485 /ORGANISM="Prymnesium parvum" /LENGTH=76 /DNA_ID=CAMNT_0000114429 /DNA_START=88 /DNA_END=314 /DNA_ORIENTATION=+ /assembly_acc=CAM_ASM_000153
MNLTKLCAQTLFATMKRTGFGYLRSMRALARADQLNQLVRHAPLPQSRWGCGGEGAPLWRGEASPPALRHAALRPG